MTARQKLRRDRDRYPAGAWATERSLWAIGFFRWGEAMRGRPGFHAKALRRLHTHLRPFVDAVTGCEIGGRAQIGPGLRVYHGTGIVIHPDTVIGENVVIMHGVTLGTREPAGAAPMIGDRVEIGAHAIVLGPVRVGDDARVGALALVTHDVPAGHTAKGIPARSAPSAAGREEPGRHARG